MTASAIIEEINKLSLAEKLLIIETTASAIRKQKDESLSNTVDELNEEYNSNKELTIFTQLDSQPFYETR